MTLLLNSFSWVFGHIPLRLAHLLGSGVGFSAWLFNFRKKEINQRICDCLGVTWKEANGIQRRMYRNLGWTVSEFFRLPYMREAEALDLLQLQNTEQIPEDRKYIALVAHTGNWELLAASTPLQGFGNLNIVVKTLKPPQMNTWICKARTRWGTRVHDRRGSSRNLLRVLKTGEPLGFILDQNAKNNWGVFVDFFGKPACTTDGLAQLAAISGYEIHPVFCRRDMKTRKLIAEVGEVIPGPKDRSPEEIIRVTAECTKKIEDFVRKYPDQWIWMHRRWRTQKPA
ncbi:lysophospholipid acyltransferase family protein [Kiritimatiellaeota bacterium B1221]|nr:lysophospholipid acyltransferase family protein [Kiritimatiellaeota bacterium B1221]